MSIRVQFTVAMLVVLGLGATAYSGNEDDRDEEAKVTVLATFNPALGQLPEGIAVDKKGNIYFGMIGTGEIWKIAPDGAPAPFVDLGPGPVLGLKTDRQGNVYAATGPNKKVWRVAPDGTTTLLANVADAGVLNDLALDKKRNVWVTDSFNGRIYRVDRNGSVTLWLDDPLLKTGFCPHPIGPRPPGVNGIALEEGNLFVANTTQGSIVRIPLMDDGSPGIPVLVAGPTCDLVGADGIVFGEDGELYVALNIQDRVIRIDLEDGDVEILATEADGLRFPATLAFGAGALAEEDLFVANIGLRFACCWSQTGPPQPRLVKIQIDD